MNRKIFRSNLAVALIVSACSVALICAFLYQIFESQFRAELKRETEYISYSVERQGIDFINNFNKSENRITLISPDGTVLADTMADQASLDNHVDRKEVREAMENGTGSSVRYSDTLMRSYIYYAMKLEDGNILRVSTAQYSVIAILLGLIYPMLIIFVIALIIAFLVSKRVYKAVVNPINDIDLDEPLNNDTYEELTPLLNRISFQKKAIERQIKEIRRQQDEFQLITENMNEGFLVIDKHTNLLLHNRSALKLLGIDEVSNGRSVLIMNRTKNFREVIEKALSGERAESSMMFADRNYSLIANPTFEDKKIIGAVIVIFDITERARREQLRREFTTNVSHELKTPLTSISGFAELMKNGDIPQNDVIDFSKSIYDESQRLISLVHDIIKISELDEGNIGLEKEPVDLKCLSEEVCSRLQSEAEKKGITITEIGDKVVVLGVRKILDEMIYNLVDNAVKYNKENGMVDVILNTTDDRIKITVRDTGIGIPASCIDRVFERFYRVDKSHSKEIGGTGLGLAIVKHGAMFHNADVKLESIEGKGTSVTLSFEKP